MKSTEAFKTRIKGYLDNLASTDELFAITYAKEGKSIDDCCTYIINEVEKTGCNGFAPDEIFGMAVHYYDEDKIDVGKANKNVRIVVDHVVEITEAEKAEAKQKALKKLEDEARAKMTKKPVAKKADPITDLNKPNLQASLF